MAFFHFFNPLFFLLQSTNACLDVADYSTADQAEVYTYYPCHPQDPSPAHEVCVYVCVDR